MKTTLATIKSFIRNNAGNLYINVTSEFDGMTDCCESRNEGFHKANKLPENFDRTLGVSGAWFVGSSRDYFREYNESGMTGYEVTNCCGRFIIAIVNDPLLYALRIAKEPVVNDEPVADDGPTMKVSMVILSHLSDVQELSRFLQYGDGNKTTDLAELNRKTNFVKWLILKYRNVDTLINPDKEFTQFNVLRADYNL